MSEVVRLQSRIRSLRKAKFICRLKEFRDMHQLSTRQLERACGIDRSTILTAEYGTDISISAALRIAQFFKVPVQSIWMEIHEKP